jgi:hypothetical protein
MQVPAEQLPTGSHTCWVCASRQVEAGGVLQLRRAPTQVPLAPQASMLVQASPSLQAAPTSTGYWQEPATHDPARKHMGGLAHVEPTQGSGMQTSFAQPWAQAWVVWRYWQAPLTHVPGDAYETNEVAPRHLPGGGVVHETAAPSQRPAVHRSAVVHASPSSHGVPSPLGT